MRLREFVPLINALPVAHQAFRSKRNTWTRFYGNQRIGPTIRNIFGEEEYVLLSRDDVFAYAAADDLDQFVMATIIWGYPRGMRGNHVRNLSQRLDELLACLRQAKSDGINDWVKHFFAIDIDGLGLSTYTKLLYFLRVQVVGLPALILDDRLIKVARREVFSELLPLTSIASHNASEKYPDYLTCMHTVAKDLSVDPAALELFLFVFGSNLKPPRGQPGGAGNAP